MSLTVIRLGSPMQVIASEIVPALRLTILSVRLAMPDTALHRRSWSFQPIFSENDGCPWSSIQPFQNLMPKGLAMMLETELNSVYSTSALRSAPTMDRNAMAKLSDLIPVLSRLFDVRDFPEETVAVFARHLRLARLLSTGGRGLGGADMTPADCTNMILAMTSGLPAKDAAGAIEEYRKLKAPYVEWMRDEDAPRIAWLDELEGAAIGKVIDRLIASAMTEEFAELGRVAMTSTTVGNWYVLVKINSPKPGGEVLIGGGVPQFGGELRQYNKIIAAMSYSEGVKTRTEAFDANDPAEWEKMRASHRGWNSDRIRTEMIGRGTIETLGALLVGRNNEFYHRQQRNR